MILEPGSIFEEAYLILNRIGQGGMGSIYKAKELELERVVAIKILRPDLMEEEEQRIRFRREGKLLSELSHRNILRFFRFGLRDGTVPYIVMEYIDGESLSDLLAESGGLTLSRTLFVISRVCEAMYFCHSHGIIHRDLSPSNIMIGARPDSDDVKVLDFGLAHSVDGRGARLTQTGALLGCVHYMSPEQCNGATTDLRSDIYSLGCVLFQCLAGEPPFRADSPVGLMHKHQTAPPPQVSPRGVAADAHEQETLLFVDAIIAKAMAKEPAARYQTMKEFGSDIKSLLDGRIDELSVQLPSSDSRMSVLVIGVLIVCLVLIAFLLFNR